VRDQNLFTLRKRLTIEEQLALADDDITIGIPRFAEWKGPDLNAGTLVLEDGVTFGPFETEHFRAQADGRLRTAFYAFVRSEILPRLKGPTPRVEGWLLAAYDHERHLGPNSALKFRYNFGLTFSSTKGEQSVKGGLHYDPSNGTFSTGSLKLFWVSFSSSEINHMMMLVVDRVAYRYQQGQRNILCPRCKKALLDFNCEAGWNWASTHCSSCRWKAGFDPVGICPRPR